MHMMMRRVWHRSRRQRRFMRFDRFAGNQLALQDLANLRSARRGVRGEFLERIASRRQGSILLASIRRRHSGHWEYCRGQQQTHFTSRHGHGISLARTEPCEFHSVGLKLVQKSLDIGPKNLLASLCLSRRKEPARNQTTERLLVKSHNAQHSQYVVEKALNDVTFDSRVKRA